MREKTELESDAASRGEKCLWLKLMRKVHKQEVMSLTVMLLLVALGVAMVCRVPSLVPFMYKMVSSELRNNNLTTGIVDFTLSYRMC